MIDIIFIAYQFPPLNTGGSIRPLKFVKYFHQYEINPIVCTLSPKSYELVYDEFSTDNEMLREIPPQIEIRHIPSEKLINKQIGKIKNFINIYFNVIGGYEGNFWKKNLFHELESIFKTHKPKLILISAPPFSIIPLAVEASKKYNVPLILTMRDSLSMWIDRPYASYIHFWKTKQLEASFFLHAKSIVGVTKQMINDWKQIHGNVFDNKYEVITNGLDVKIEDIYSSQDQFTPHISDKKFVIGYVGSFYYIPQMREQIFSPWWKRKPNRMIQYVPRKEDWLYRSPYFFLKAVQYLITHKPELKDKLSIIFVGQKPDWLDSMVKEFGLEKVITHLGQISYENSLKFQHSCDALLATSVKVIGGEDYCIAGKTFEYVTMRKPILGFVTKGAQLDFLEGSGMALICNPDHTALSARKLYKLITGKYQFKPDIEFLKQFERVSLTEKISNIIKKHV
ncbi:MAG: hypothetical protein HYU69_10790 [Bacteroidetes bacterium]|nr:hypothetical protein [Bacteroidota bacterium]